ncbi:MAG: hypothetical protein OXO52_20650 [Rhodospirillales bacterium]|nr:hypothetical protein [Rhodospirillales bacterium]MDE0381369.1 hypothetical protein [Rhodospirillales bacterium]
MAARKDDGQEPPRGGNRPTPIWRLPAAQSADAPDAPDAPKEQTDRRPPRRIPQAAVVWGLAAALVCVGLYAAWATVGPEILGTAEETELAGASATGGPVAEQAGAGPADEGTAGPPPADAETTSLAVAEEEAGAGARAEALEDPQATVSADRGGDAAPPEDAGASAAAPQAAAAPDPASPAPDPPSPSPALAEDSPEEAAPAMLQRDEEPAPAGNASEEPSPAATSAEAEPRAPAPASIDVAADALGTLDARLDALEAESAGASGAGAAVAALEQRVQALEQDPAQEAFDRALATWEEQRARLETALAEVSARLARFEEEATRHAAADGHLVGLVLASGDLTAALASPRPFAPVLDTFRGVAGEDSEIESALARLAPFAATGVPTLGALKSRFPAAANAIVRAAPAAEDSDWIDETVTKLSQLVTIRRTGGAIDPASLDGRLVEAESALVEGDLARAVAIVEALMPEARGAERAESWLRDARARAEVDDALAGLVAVVHARIGARWATTGGAQ